MISITKVQVPSHLVGSEFYNSLDGDDSEEFSIPARNFKQSTSVNSVGDAAHLLRTLQYWGVSVLPNDLVSFMICKHAPEQYEQMCQTLRDFDAFPGLLDNYRTLQGLDGRFSLTEIEWILVKDLNVMPILTSHLFRCDEAMSERALALLDIVVNTHKESRYHVLTHLNANIHSSLNNESIGIVRNYAMLLANLFAQQRDYKEMKGTALDPLLFAILPTLSHLLHHNDEQVVDSACDALYSITQRSESQMMQVFDLGVAPRYVQLLGSPIASIQLTALQTGIKYWQPTVLLYATDFIVFTTVGEFVCVHGYPVPRLIGLGVLPALKDLLDTSVLKLVTNTCWVVGNIAVNSPEDFQAVIDAEIIEKVLELQSVFRGNKNNVAFLLRSVSVTADTTHLPRLLDMGIVFGLCKLLPTPFMRVLEDALAGLRALLRTCLLLPEPHAAQHRAVAQMRECGGLRVLRTLNAPPRTEIETCVDEILEQCEQHNLG